MTDHDHATADARSQHETEPAIDWEAAYAGGGVPATPVDTDLVAVARSLQPGTALDLGCGAGQNCIWLAERGWRVLGVDIAGSAIRSAEAAAREADVSAHFERDDLTSWNTDDHFDLVVSTYALPPRGRGRTHTLTVARDAVAPGGVALVAEFEVSLAGSGWMAEDHLVTLEEITDMFPGFHLDRAEVVVAAHGHGEETRRLPIAIVVARHPGPLGATS